MKHMENMVWHMASRCKAKQYNFPDVSLGVGKGLLRVLGAAHDFSLMGGMGFKIVWNVWNRC